MPVLTNIGELAVCPAAGGQAEIGRLRDAALVWHDGRVLWTGASEDVPTDYGSFERLDARRGLVIPGLVDCHTHLAFGGWRADEWAARIDGATYLELAREGGGIASTVRATRDLEEEALLARARGFARQARDLGVTTLECKSGYGLTLEDELKLLRVYRRLGREGPTRIVPTLLGAHVVPSEFADQRHDYVRLVCEEMIPAAASAGLARFCDVFVEEGAFTVVEARRILTAAARFGLGAKLHADQLTDGGGALLAAERGAVSADHLEAVSDAGIAALAEAGVVAVTLPLAGLYLDQPPAPARALIEAGVPVAVATDFNPGTAPSFHLPLALNLACNRQRMTPAEALKGATAIAARAIGQSSRIGSLERGKASDFVWIDAESVEDWLYHFTGDAGVVRVYGGERPLTAASGPT